MGRRREKAREKVRVRPVFARVFSLFFSTLLSPPPPRFELPPRSDLLGRLNFGPKFNNSVLVRLCLVWLGL
jgi:hypothetical protein